MNIVVSNGRGAGKGASNLGSMSNASPARLPSSLLASPVVHGPAASTMSVAGISIVFPFSSTARTHLGVTLSASSSRDSALAIVSFVPSLEQDPS
jgi:hypothetical protein